MKRRKLNVNADNASEYLPPGYKLKLRHLHPGNSTPIERRNITHEYGIGTKTRDRNVPPKYVTIAKVFNASGNLVSVGVASCSNRDNPQRPLGHHIAAGRAVKQVFPRTSVLYDYRPVHLYTPTNEVEDLQAR